MIRIALDAMGGDHAPHEEVKAAMKAVNEYNDIQIILYGDPDQILSLISDKNLLESQRIKIEASSEIITMSDEPVKAIRRKKDSSMVKAAKAVKENQADAIVSSGNTGALLAAGLLIIGRIKGIDRPGLMALIPTLKGPRPHFIFMDSGANADSKAINLHQFAIIANYYAKEILHIEKPRVALLNNGTEASKGSSLSKEAYALLSQEEMIHFIGNIESKSLLSGQADIVITDGFTGNAVLKNIEGVATSLIKHIKEILVDSGLKTKLGALLIKDALKEGLQILDTSKAGGAILLGVKAPVIKTHGSADSEAIKYAIFQARSVVQGQVISKITDYYQQESDQEN